MKDITYEQFADWCKYWNYTIDEGHKAMCFTSNIINQHFGNCIDYADKVSNDDSHSDAFKTLVGTFKDDAMVLSILYGKLEFEIFNMLEKHDEGTD